MSAVGIQAADAHAKADMAATLLGGEVDESFHPGSGLRESMDDMLNIIEAVFVPAGKEPSPFGEQDFSAAARMEPKIWISPEARGRSVQAILWDRPRERPMAFLFASAEQRHPQLGSGALVRIHIPLDVPEDQGVTLGHEFNRFEEAEVARCHLLGAWCYQRDLGLSFITFLPAATYRKGLLEAMCLSMGVRALWASSRLEEASLKADRLREKLESRGATAERDQAKARIRSLRGSPLDVLLVVNDVQLGEFMLNFLRHHQVTVASSPAEAQGLLERHRYGLVIVTNFGIGPSEAVSVMREQRDYPVLFLTGYMDEAVKVLCSTRNIPWRMVPIEPGALHRELRLALDDLRP